MYSMFRRVEVRVGVVYIVLSTLWIVVSDRLLVSLVLATPALFESALIFKDLGFVFITTVSIFIVVRMEVQKRNRVEKELQQERDLSPVGIATLTATGAIRYANSQAERILELTRDPNTYQTYRTPLWHITDYDGKPVPEHSIPFAQVMKTQQAVYAIQHAITWQDGRRVLLEINAAPIFDSQGVIREVVTTFQDVTTVQTQAKLLRDSEDHVRLLIEQAADSIFVTDEQGNLVLVNERGCETLGYTHEEMMQLRMQDLFLAEGNASAPTQVEAVTVGEVLTEERQLRCKDGSLLPVEVKATILPSGNLQRIVHDLTDRKQAEERFLYQADLIENISDAIVSTDLNFVIQSWNKAAEILYGWSAHEVIGKSTDEVLPTTYIHNDGDAVLADFRKEGFWKGEVVQHRRDGTPIDILASVSLTYDGTGKSVGAVTINRDITDYKRLEHQQKELLEQLQLAITTAKLGIWRLDMRSGNLEWNDHLLDIYGITREVFSNDMNGWRDRVHPEDRNSSEMRLNTVLTEGQVFDVNFRVVRPDGETRYVNASANSIYDKENQVIALIGVNIDVTHVKHSEAKLQQTNEMLQSIIEHIPVLIALFDENEQLDFVNQHWIEQLGWTVEELNRQPHPFNLLYPDPNYRQQVLAYMFSSQPGWRDFQTHTSSEKILETTWAFVRLSNGSRISIGQDITERKRSETSLKHYAQRMEILHQIDIGIINATSIQNVIDAALKHIRQIILCQRASVVLLDQTTQECIIFADDANRPYSISQSVRIPIPPNWDAGFGSQTSRVFDDLRLVQPQMPAYQMLIKDGLVSGIQALLVVQGQRIGLLGLNADTPGFFTPEHQEIATEIANQIAIAIQSEQLRETIQSDYEQLQTLSARLIETQEAERRYIARELHDEIGQTLTALSLMLNMKTRHNVSDEKGSDLGEVQTLVNDLMKRVRELSLDLRPSMLDDFGLIPTLAWYFKRYEQQSGIMIDFKYSDIDRRFAPAIEITLYRLIQETLTNVARHAQVKQVSVQLWATPETIHAQIEDSGIGFDLEAVQTANKTGGILGLRERTQLVGGICEIESSLGAGTIISVHIPLYPSN